MKARHLRAWLAAALLGFGATAWGADNGNDMVAKIRELGWRSGPTQAQVGSRATLRLDEQASMLGESDSATFLKLTGNLPSDGVNIVHRRNWWATFEFDEAGYVKDDEKIDADALLRQMKESDGPANAERHKLGMAELYTDGWHMPPRYDPETHRLEWALRLRAQGDPAPVINYTVRLLGRSGYERAVLVSSPETLDADVKEFKTLLEGFDFNSGEKYAEFKQGDRVAQFGLAALVAGGAAAVASKTGFWKVLLGFLAAFWKVIAGVAIALVAGLGRLFGGSKKST